MTEINEGSTSLKEQLLARMMADFEWPSLPAMSAFLVDQLGLDSLDLFFLVMLIEDVAGIAVPNLPAEYPTLVIVGDAVSYLEQLRRAVDVSPSE